MLGESALLLVTVILVCFHGIQEVQARQMREVISTRASPACGQGNPIDDCWRCSDSPWDQNLKKLADCALGFGRNAVGGKQGKQYIVTSSDDDDDPTNPKNGTLRHAVIQQEPLWITFASNMTIHLETELAVASHKTIDGRGAEVRVTGNGCIMLKNVNNVIIHGIHIHGCQTDNEWSGDAITVFGARDVWIDHCTLSDSFDGLIDVVHNSTAVTISNNHFFNHDKVILLGASDDDKESERNLSVTVAFNRFGENLVQRMPRCRHGKFHVVNNHYNRWSGYAIGGTANPSILSQGNIYIAPDEKSKKEVTSRNNANDDWKKWNWLSDGDELVNGAFFIPSGSSDVKDYSSVVSMEARPSSQVNAITAQAGVLKCSRGENADCKNA